MERALKRNAGVERVLPVTLEVDRIDKNQSSVFIENARWNDLRHFVVGLLRDPAVDRCRRATPVISATTTQSTACRRKRREICYNCRGKFLFCRAVATTSLAFSYLYLFPFI